MELKQFFVRDKCFEIFVPDAEQMKMSYKKGLIDFPYWSQVWPAALAMADFLLRHPEYIQAKKVLELAAGLGLPSIIAATDAKHVICSDYLPEAVDAMKQSAMHNRLANVETKIINWHALPANLEADVLLLSDINYTPGIFEMQQHLINDFLEKGTTIILSTPQRLVAKSFIAAILPVCRMQENITVHQEGKEVMTTVMVLEKKWK